MDMTGLLLFSKKNEDILILRETAKMIFIRL